MDHSLQEQSASQEKARCEVQVGLVGAGTSGGMGTWGGLGARGERFGVRTEDVE